MTEVFLGLGSNLGDRYGNIRAAINEINNRIGVVVRQSDLIETEPQGYDSKNKYVNAAVVVATTLSPIEVLRATQQIERELGRTNKRATIDDTTAYQDRTIDIDILIYEGIIMHTPQLTLPHPRIEERDFVKKPLSQILYHKNKI